jgi:hypothetical protein
MEPREGCRLCFQTHSRSSSYTSVPSRDKVTPSGYSLLPFLQGCGSPRWQKHCSTYPKTAIFSSYSILTYGIFRDIVGNCDPAVKKIILLVLPLVTRILHLFPSCDLHWNSIHQSIFRRHLSPGVPFLSTFVLSSGERSVNQFPVIRAYRKTAADDSQVIEILS